MLPGVVNAHTHLELSWLRGRIAETDDFPGWIRSVVTLIRETRDHAEEAQRAVSEAIDEAQRCGTALVGDISNDLVASRPLAERGLAAVVFHELIGFKTANAPKIVNDALARLAMMPSSDVAAYLGTSCAVLGVAGALSRNPHSA